LLSPLPRPDLTRGRCHWPRRRKVAVFALVTGVNHRVAAFGYRGGSFFDRREFSMAGTLVRHPRGDLLIDTGFGRHIDEQFATLPLIFRAITSYSLWQPAADQLKAAIRPEIAARHSSDPCTLGSRQRPARLSRRARMGDAAGARIHQEGAAADNSANLLPAYDMKSMGSKGARTSDFLKATTCIAMVRSSSCRHRVTPPAA
jgi:hypothetical protein